MQTAAIVAASGASVRQPATHSLADASAVADWLNQGTTAEWVIIKPNNGTASRGVRRERRTQVRDLQADNAGQPNLIQDWIEPATMRRRGKPYRFDVRVFVVDGAPVAAFARTAAAPATDRFAGSPLSWLTTTGPLAPIVRSSNSALLGHSGAVCLSAALLEDLNRQSERVVAALDSAALLASVTEAVSSIPSYQELAGIEGEMAVIRLCGRVTSAA